jgi:hypothetical protein
MYDNANTSKGLPWNKDSYGNIEKAWTALKPLLCFEACKIIKEEVPTCLTYQQINLWGVNERVNWKARPDERLFVFDMSFKK